MDLGGDKLAIQRLREAAEKAKIELSSAMSTVRQCRFTPGCPQVDSRITPG